MPQIDKLLADDETNVVACKERLHSFSPALPTIINDSADLYDTVSRIYGQSISENDSHYTEFVQLLGEFGAGPEGSIDELAKREPRAAAAVSRYVSRYVSREIRGVLIARISLFNVLQFADFLRYRVTSALAYSRIQVESLALIKLMTVSPELAEEWRDVEPGEGWRFHSRHRGDIGQAIDELGLRFAYDQASEVALHSRFAGLAQGLDVIATRGSGKLTRKFSVRAQEIDPDDPSFFLIMVLGALRNQQRLLEGLPACVPEINDPLFIETRLPNYKRAVDELFDRMPDLYRRHLDPGSTIRTGG